MGNGRKDLKSKSYQAQRRRFLDEWDGPCHWCRRARATELDHVVPVDAGIDPTDQSNWVGACRKCNSRRGAEHLARKRQARIKARTAAMEVSAGEFFETEQTATPIPYIPAIPGNMEDETEPAEPVAAKTDESGLILPRLESQTRGTGSYGPEVAALAKDLLSVELMPWQVHALSGQLQHDDAGDLTHRRALCSVARQNGKTVALKSLILWALLKEPERRGEPLLVINTAHSLDLASEIFDALAPMLQEDFGAKVYWSYGRQEVKLPNGTRWLVQAATPKAFHGFSPTYIIADEVWSISRDVLLNGALPSQRVMRSPLLSCWSTAGTESSLAMLQMREEGIRAIDEGKPSKLYFAEWSVPPGIDPMTSPDAWPLANPAIGHTLDPSVLDDESRQVDRAAFLRASLNVWVTATNSWLEPGTFDKLKVDAIPAGGVLAVDSDLDESTFFGVRAQKMPDGEIGVTVAFMANSVAACWDEIDRIAPECEKVALTPSLFDLAPPALDRKKVQVGYGELATHTGTIRQLIHDGRVVHTGEQMLSEHVERAVGVKTQRGYVLSSQKSAGPITLARCMIFAAALIARPRSKAKPAIAFGR